MNASILIRSLKEVPETNLKLLEIARKTVKEDGEIDPEKVAFNMKEVEEAAGEAEEYAKETQEALSWLKRLALL